jgi:predicted nucleic acid-binding protein
MERHADLPMDLADASLVWLADEAGVRDIATFDERGFSVYRLSGGKRFNNLIRWQRR